MKRSKNKKTLADVTTCDYIADMSTLQTSILTDGEPMTEEALMRETASPLLQQSVSVRTAKAHLSGLLEQVAGGQEIVITSDGVPKARLVPISTKKRLPFLGTREHLATMPPWTGGITSEEIVREDRDSRGW